MKIRSLAFTCTTRHRRDYNGQNSRIDISKAGTKTGRSAGTGREAKSGRAKAGNKKEEIGGGDSACRLQLLHAGIQGDAG